MSSSGCASVWAVSPASWGRRVGGCAPSVRPSAGQASCPAADSPLFFAALLIPYKFHFIMYEIFTQTVDFMDEVLCTVLS